MWLWKGAMLLGMLVEAALATQYGFYAPQYELLDPRTGRSLSHKFKIVQTPVLEEKSSSNSNSNRQQREADFFSGYFQPEGYAAPVVTASKSSSSSPTYFTQDRERADRSLGSQSGFVSPSESSGFFSSERSEPNFFHLFGSNGNDRQSDFRFGQSSFPSSVPSSFSFSPSSSSSSPSSSSSSTRFGGERIRNKPRRTRQHHQQDRRNPIEKDFFVRKPVPSKKESIDSNKFNGLQAHKWRKRYPYYGRKKRSADPVFASPSHPTQLSSWVLLDPITGRPKESRETPRTTTTSNRFFPETPNNFFSDTLPSQSLEFHHDSDNGFFSFKRRPVRRPQQQEAPKPARNLRVNYAGEPIYKHYRKYPYYG
jgi:hypothetical protein